MPTPTHRHWGLNSLSSVCFCFCGPRSPPLPASTALTSRYKTASRQRRLCPRSGRSCVTTLGKLFTPTCVDADSLRYYMESLNWVPLPLRRLCFHFLLGLGGWSSVSFTATIAAYPFASCSLICATLALRRISASIKRDLTKTKQVATVMVASACIAAEHGSFNRIRQEAPVCTLRVIHGSLVPPREAASEGPIDRFSRFCRTQCQGWQK